MTEFTIAWLTVGVLLAVKFQPDNPRQLSKGQELIFAMAWLAIYPLALFFDGLIKLAGLAGRRV